MAIIVPIEISARHIHLSLTDLEILFGKNYQLNKLRDLSQPGEFACQETLTIKTDKNQINLVRVIGPTRPQTQVEISRTDARFLGLNPPVRNSEDLKDSEVCILIGPQGQINLSEGVILAWRHIHVNPDFLKKNNFEAGRLVSVKIASGPRETFFNNVYLKQKDSFVPAFHIDTDEANAAGVKDKIDGEIIV